MYPDLTNGEEREKQMEFMWTPQEENNES